MIGCHCIIAIVQKALNAVAGWRCFELTNALLTRKFYTH